MSGSFSWAQEKLPLFRFHQSSEPSLLDPHRLKSSSGQFLLQNLHRNLFRYDDEKGLVPDLAKSCRREKRALVCELKPDLKWSDGQPLTARDFLTAYLRILKPETQAARADLLFPIKGAEDYYRTGKGSIGVSVQGAGKLRFEFAKDDPDFEYNLSSPILAPFKPHKAGETPKVFSGPYRIQTWERGRRLHLVKNEFYPGGNPARPETEVLFIEDDGIALKLFEKGELDFLRRLPTLYLSKYRKNPEFHWIPLLRLDYLGFGPRLKDRPRLREALSLSLHYEELRKIFQSEGRPGCPGLPEAWLASGKLPCHPYEPAKAKELLKKVDLTGLEPLRLAYSAVGGEDHRRAAEWEQDQWRKNLGLKIGVRGLENKVFLAELKNNPPDLFRRGVGADRPTCRAFLETFTPGHPENFLHLDDPEFNAALEKLKQGSSEAQRKKACEEGLSRLMQIHAYIPLGQMHFAVLAKTKFTGWKLNSMNQLDLSELSAKP